MKKAQPPADKTPDWRELRDARGRLYGRVNERRLLLEVGDHRQRVTFDLRNYVKVLKDIDIGKDID